jgi:hypothetical protein
MRSYYIQPRLQSRQPHTKLTKFTKLTKKSAKTEAGAPAMRTCGPRFARWNDHRGQKHKRGGIQSAFVFLASTVALNGGRRPPFARPHRGRTGLRVLCVFVFFGL